MSKNIYNYVPPKSMNEEVHFFLTKGRISRKAFFLRLLFIVCLLLISNLIFFYSVQPKYDFYYSKSNYVELDNTFFRSYNYFMNFNMYVLPIFSFIFISLQAVKRIHDTNNSGWQFLIPIYNIILLFKSGTEGENNFGLDPQPKKVVKYFDELNESNKQPNENQQSKKTKSKPFSILLFFLSLIVIFFFLE